MAKAKVPRTRNAGTMTEAAYFNAIRSALRQVFSRWKVAELALRAARREISLEDRRERGISYRFEYQCSICEAWLPRTVKENGKPKTIIQADHVEPVGRLNSLDDLPEFVRRLTPEDPSAYQCVCVECHAKKTALDRARLRKERKQ